MTRALTAAPLARLKAQVPSQVTVYDGAVPVLPNKPRLPYLVYYPSTVPLRRDRLGPVSALATVRFQITSVGQLRENAQAVDDAAQAALVDWQPAVPGWDCGPIERDPTFTAPISRDDDVTPPVFYAVAQYLFTAVPA